MYQHETCNRNQLAAAELSLLHKAGSLAQADVYLTQLAGRQVVLKDFANRPWLLRLLYSRVILRRELRLLGKVQPLDGVPAVYGLLDADAMVMEYIDGQGVLQSRRDLPAGTMPGREFFAQLQALVRQMHDLGIAHGDIRRRNILRDRNDQPVLIDFATAVEAGRHRLGDLLFEMFRKADDAAVLKLQHSYYPESLTDAELQRLHQRPWYVRTGQFLRHRIYRRFLKQKHWRQRLRRLTTALANLLP